jgi:extradiol dioxygenase family protein
MNPQFHLSLPCRHLEATRRFFTEIIGATVGRQSNLWCDINLFGHQITYTQCGAFRFDYPNYSFEKTILPSFHFGVVLQPAAWNELHDRLEREEFLHTLATEFLAGRVGAHRSFFVKDPNGFLIEFKCFDQDDEVFAH